MSQSNMGRGEHTLAETLSQPQCWAKCLEGLQNSGELEAIGKRFGASREWLFVGCGSSYYLAQSAAAAWAAITGLRARATAASELLLFPDTVLAGSAKDTLKHAPWQPGFDAAVAMERERQTWSFEQGWFGRRG